MERKNITNILGELVLEAVEKGFDYCKAKKVIPSYTDKMLRDDLLTVYYHGNEMLHALYNKGDLTRHALTVYVNSLDVMYFENFKNI